MGLFDKFKKKENVVTQEQPEVKQEVQVNGNEVSNNQTVAAEVSLENNPFFEEVAPVEAPVQADVPNFDNIFNAQPTELINNTVQMNEQVNLPNINETASLIDNPSVVTENNVLSVDPVAVFEGGDSTYDEITELVSGVVAENQGIIESTEVVNVPVDNGVQEVVETVVNPEPVVNEGNLETVVQNVEIELPQEVAMPTEVIQEGQTLEGENAVEVDPQTILVGEEPAVVIQETNPELAPIEENQVDTVIAGEEENVDVTYTPDVGNLEVPQVEEVSEATEEENESQGAAVEYVEEVQTIEEPALESNQVVEDVVYEENVTDEVVAENQDINIEQEDMPIYESGIEITSAPILEQIEQQNVQEESVSEPVTLLSSDQTAQELAVDSSIIVNNEVSNEENAGDSENSSSDVVNTEISENVGVAAESEPVEEISDDTVSSSDIVLPQEAVVSEVVEPVIEEVPEVSDVSSIEEEEIQDINVTEDFIPLEIANSISEAQEMNEEVTELEVQPVVELTDELVNDSEQNVSLDEVEASEETETTNEVENAEVSEVVQDVEGNVEVALESNDSTLNNETDLVVPTEADLTSIEEQNIPVEPQTIIETAEEVDEEPIEDIVSQEIIIPEINGEVDTSNNNSIEGEDVTSDDESSLESENNVVNEESSVEKTSNEDTMSLLERTNEMILSSILEADDEETEEPDFESEESNNEVSLSEEVVEPTEVEAVLAPEEKIEDNQDSSEDVSNEEEVSGNSSDIKPLIEEEEMELPIIASVETKEDETDNTDSNNTVAESYYEQVTNTEVQEESELRPIIEEDETVILPILTDKDIARYEEKEEVTPIVKPIIEDEEEELNIGESEEPFQTDSKELEEEKLPVLDLEEPVEEQVEEKSENNLEDSELTNEDTNNATDLVSDEPIQIKEEAPQFDFKPFMSLNNIEMESQEASPVAVETKEEIGIYISDPTPTKFCNNCGIMLTDDSSICPSCGEPID